MTRKRFNTVTVAIPAQSFDIRSHVALERSVPVMTEFAIRLLHTVGPMGLESIRDYFGLQGKEVRQLLNQLNAENLIRDHDGLVSLSDYALIRFESSQGSSPRFTKIVERRGRVAFELLTFQHLPKDLSSAHSNCAIDLQLPADLEIEKTVERAEKAYIDQFHDIERFIQSDEQKRAFDVYKVDEISSHRRFSLPYTVHFEVDASGHVEHVFDDQLPLPLELQERLHSLVADTIAIKKRMGKDALFDFAFQVGDSAVLSHFSAKGFSLSEYLKRFHGDDSQICMEDSETFPIFGALYLPDNVELILQRFRKAVASFREAHKGERIKHTMYWIAPSNSLWGRSQILGHAIEELSKVGKSSLKNFRVCIVRRQRTTTVKRDLPAFADAGGLDLLFSDSVEVDERAELLILPGVFAATLYHTSIPSTVSTLAPVGFVTSEPDRVSKVQALASMVLEKAHTRYVRSSASNRFEEELVSPDQFTYLKPAQPVPT